MYNDALLSLYPVFELYRADCLRDFTIITAIEII